MLLIQFLGLFAIPSLLFAYFSDPQPMKYLGLRQPSKAKYWLLGILLMALAYPAVEYLGLLNQKIDFGTGTRQWMKGLEEEAAKQIQFMLGKNSLSELIANLVFIAAFAGVGEELFFRGILQKLFIRIFKSPWAGIILSAAVFSAFHFQFYGFLPRLVLGALLGAMYWYSGSLWVPILVHFLYDAVIIVVLYFNPAMMENPGQPMINSPVLAVAAGISAVVTVLLLLYMAKSSANSYEKVYADDFPPPQSLSF